jgi:phage baseplate assembly protein W
LERNRVTQLKLDPQKAFLGVGWNFPPQIDASGTMALALYEQDVHQSIRIILATNPGERVMRPDFGAGLNDFVFEPVSTTTMHQLQTRVQEALVNWEPRIDVQQVNVTADPMQRSLLLIDISYQIRATNTLANLVYPFYLLEGATL